MNDLAFLREFLDLVKNPEKYARLLSELETRQKQVNDLIAVAGDAQQIPLLLEQAQRTSAKAEKEAGKLVEDARQAAQKVLDNAAKVSEEVTTLRNEVAAQMGKAKAEQREAQELIQKHSALVRENEDRQARILAYERILSEKEQALNDALNKLREDTLPRLKELGVL